MKYANIFECFGSWGHPQKFSKGQSVIVRLTAHSFNTFETSFTNELNDLLMGAYVSS